MLDVRMAPDCGNAPKRQFLLDFTIALADNNTEAVSLALDPDVLWHRVGTGLFRGSEVFLAALPVFPVPVSVLTINTVLTHGSAGSIRGVFQDQHGRETDFCDVHEFTGHSKTARLKSITSYWIPRPVQDLAGRLPASLLAVVTDNPEPLTH